MRCVLSREASIHAVFELGARAYRDRITANRRNCILEIGCKVIEVGVGRNDKARRNGKARGLDLMERRSLPAGRYGIKVRVSQKGQSDCVFCCRGFHALTLADSPTQVL